MKTVAENVIALLMIRLEQAIAQQKIRLFHVEKNDLNQDLVFYHTGIIRGLEKSIRILENANQDKESEHVK